MTTRRPGGQGPDPAAPARRLRAALTHLLAALLLAQWAVAFAHCLAPLHAAAPAGGAHSVEICGADGLQTVLLDDEGRPVREEPAVPGRPTCPECCGPVALQPPPPPAVAARVAWMGTAPARPVDGLPVPPARAPPQQPRAPPAA